MDARILALLFAALIFSANASPLRRSEGDNEGSDQGSDQGSESDADTENDNNYRVISFGDSLSDVGSYGTPGLQDATTVGGGKFTVNSPTSKIWVELVAQKLGSSLCPYEIGLNGGTTQFSLMVAQNPSVKNPNCFGFAQGGARVAAAGSPTEIGTLSTPVNTQISNFLTVNGGSFSSNDVVFVQAGANDISFILGQLSVGQINGISAGAAAAIAATTLGQLILNGIVAKGAGKVVVVNVGNVAVTPASLGLPPAVQGAIGSLVATFNQYLAATLNTANSNKIIQIDAFSLVNQWVASPATFGFTVTNQPACNNPFGGALFCTTATTVANSANYIFADGAHITPFANSVFAKAVIKKLKQADVL